MALLYSLMLYCNNRSSLFCLARKADESDAIALSNNGLLPIKLGSDWNMFRFDPSFIKCCGGR